jgi:predicted dehydrogenase
MAARPPGTIGVAVIGCGAVAELHRRSIAEHAGVALRGVYDVDPDVVAARAAAWRVPAYGSLEEALADDSVDAVLVLTSEAGHVPVATAALESGKHVLVEKPVSRNSEEVGHLAAMARARGLVAMPGHNYAYLPEFARIARLARDGGLGVLRSVFVVYAIEHPEEIARLHSGVLGAIMVHHSYLSLALLGAPDDVHAGVSNPAWESHDVEDQAWMTWTYESGAVAHLSASFAVGDHSADPWSFVVKALGTRGSASMTFRSTYAKPGPGDAMFGLPTYEESYIHELQAFVDAIRSGAPLTSTMEDAQVCAGIIDRAYRSAGVPPVAGGPGSLT